MIRVLLLAPLLLALAACNSGYYAGAPAPYSVMSGHPPATSSGDWANDESGPGPAGIAFNPGAEDDSFPP